MEKIRIPGAFLLGLFFLFALFSFRAGAEVALCSGDTMIGAHPAERNLNGGARSRARVKLNEGYAIFKFDLSKLKGKKVTGGKFFIVNASKIDLVIDRVSTIPVQWEEGTGHWDKDVAGGADFFYAVRPDKKWKEDGNFLDVVFGKAGSILNSSGGVISAGKRGAIELDPVLLQSLVDDKQFGIAISSSEFKNTDVFLREQSSSKPYIEIYFEGNTPEASGKSWTFYDPPKVNEKDWKNPVICRTVADTNVLSSKGETGLNCGGLKELKLKGKEDQVLLKFDVSALRGMTVKKARLYLRQTPTCKLITLGVSTLAEDWVEGKSEYKKEVGATCFDFRKTPADLNNPLPGDYWRGPDSNFTSIAQGEAHNITCYPNVLRGEKEGWVCVDVDPWLVHDLLVYDQYGLIVSEEKGQRGFAKYMMDDHKHTNSNPNHFIYSREQGEDYAPYLVVEAEKEDDIPPAAPTGFSYKNKHNDRRLEPGEVIVNFTAPGDDGMEGKAFAYEIWFSKNELMKDNYTLAPKLPRCQVSRPSAAGEKNRLWLDDLAPGAKYWFYIKAVDEAGNRSEPVLFTAVATPEEKINLDIAPVTGVKTGAPITAGGVTAWAVPETSKVSPVTGGLLEDGTYKTGNSPAMNGNLVWNGEAESVELAGCSNEFVGFQLVVMLPENSEPRTLGFSVEGAGPLSAENVKFYREWFVYTQDKDGNKTYYPDPLFPLDGDMSVPNQPTGDEKTSNVVPGQRAGIVFVDVYIPHGTPAGKYSGKIHAGDLTVPVELRVYGFELPDTINGMVVELNNYSGWQDRYGKISDEQLAQLELSYQRESHINRLNFNSVTYSHTFNIHHGVTPKIEGSGKDMHVSDWSYFDHRYGPLFDGSAFEDLPRKGVPVAFMYLPFFENWPSEFVGRFHYDIARDMTGYIDKVYEVEVAAVVKDFMKHFNEKGWTRTYFTFFLNDKYYYFKPWRSPRGTYWLLDEPMFRDDFLALDYFAKLYRDAAAPYKGDVKVGFRADISRPQWQRDYLDNELDFFCGGYGSEFYRKHVHRQIRRYDESFSGPRIIWTYGGANNPSASNLGLEAWIVKNYINGAQGIVPWLCEGDSWDKASSTCLLYAGHRFGKLGPFSSLRIKVLRRGQQDTEYLKLLEDKLGARRSTLKKSLARIINLKSKVVKQWAEDAGEEKFKKLDNLDFERVRRTVAKTLSVK